MTRTGGTWVAKYGKSIADWDKAPPPQYFTELFRVSKHCIIWGGNYFDLPPSRNFIVWRKLSISENFTMAMAELAWTNIRGNAKVFDWVPQGKKDDPRFHPTQKPIELYQWLLSKYAKQGDRIFDTHVGSGSSRIACWEMGFDFVGCEIDRYYWEKQEERFREWQTQPKLF
ncbi:MAG: site-specific DNA-methyltransferase [Spirochaetales bacterium]|nr:site-specific DNA-methyltransferase [Spirochaetales bacterium]